MMNPQIQHLNRKKTYYWKDILSLKILQLKGYSKFISNRLNKTKLSKRDIDAFKIMGLGLDTDWPNIQKKFKTLVKKFHPDRNAGNKEFEDKLKTITLAYSHIKQMMIGKRNLK